jgi:hypothetical protein
LRTAQREEGQELVIDPLDPLLGQIHHTHEHLEDADTQVVHPLQVAAEAHPDEEDDHIRVRGRALSLYHVAEDEAMDIEAVAEEDHLPTRPMAGREEMLILSEAVLLEMTVG